MAEKELNVQIQEATKTEAEWTSSNPVLRLGQLAFSSDKNGLFKLGNGKSKWSELTYNSIPWANVTGRPSSLKNPSALTVQFNGTTNKTYDGSSAQTVNITPAAIGAAASDHTHNYAGSSSAGGSATSAIKLDTATAGSATQPVYFSGGKPVVCTYTLGASVPAEAKFTDTIYTHPTTSGNKHIPSGGSSGQILRWSADGTAVWGADYNTTYPIYYKTIDADFMTKYRTQTKGSTASGDYIATIRNNTTSVANSPQNGTGLAWGRSDTHGYMYMDYSSAVMYVGAGNEDKLNWVKQVAFLDSTVTAANKWSTARKITLTGAVTGSVTIDGTKDVSIATTVNHTHNYAGSSSAGGNANAAVKLATARTINGTSFDGSANITTANWGTARTITIGNIGKTVNGSGNVSWSLTEIGAVSLTAIETISGKKTFSSEVISTEANGFRIAFNNSGFFIRNDSDNTYFMLTNSGDPYGGWNDLRPIRINNATGNVSMGHVLDVSGKITANGGIQLPDTGGWWLGGMTATNCLVGSPYTYSSDTGGAYHPIIRQNTALGNVFNLGGITYNSSSDVFGVYVFKNGRTDNGRDYATEWNAIDGKLTHSGYLVVEGRIQTGSYLQVGNSFYYDGSIELSGGTPFIDFHFNESTADYTSRIIEAASGVLNVNGVNFSTNKMEFSYGGGWYMSDSSWLRSLNNKNIYAGTGIIRTDGFLQSGPGGAYFYAYDAHTYIRQFLYMGQTSATGVERQVRFQIDSGTYPHASYLYGGNSNSTTAIGIWDGRNGWSVFTYNDVSNCISFGTNYIAALSVSADLGYFIGGYGAIPYIYTGNGDICFRYTYNGTQYTSIASIVNGLASKASSDHTHTRIINGSYDWICSTSGNLIPRTNTTDTPHNVGNSNGYVANLYYQNQTKVSDRRRKIDQGDLTMEESLTILKGSLPKKFLYERSPESGIQYGMYAQDVRDMLISSNIGYTSMLQINLRDEEGTSITDINYPEDKVDYGLEYEQYIPHLIKGWQYLDGKLDDHESRIAQLEQENRSLKQEIASLRASV